MLPLSYCFDIFVWAAGYLDVPNRMNKVSPVTLYVSHTVPVLTCFMPVPSAHLLHLISSTTCSLITCLPSVKILPLHTLYQIVLDTMQYFLALILGLITWGLWFWLNLQPAFTLSSDPPEPPLSYGDWIKELGIIPSLLNIFPIDTFNVTLSVTLVLLLGPHPHTLQYVIYGAWWPPLNLKLDWVSFWGAGMVCKL